LPVAAAALLAACRRPAVPRPAARVLIARAPAYDDRLYASIRRILETLRPDVKGKRVLLKPNLVEFDAATCINTNPLFVHAVLEGFRALGAAWVGIAEGPGHRRITLDLAHAAGYFHVIPEFEKLFTDLNLDDCTNVALVNPQSQLRSLYLPNTVLNADLVVSLPKLKTHHWVGATLSMKNLFGIVPGAIYGWPKNILHWAGIAECIVDLHALLPHQFALVDGIDGMEGNGPIQGTRAPAGVVIVGDCLLAVDATACRVMGIDPLRVPYLTMGTPADDLLESAITQEGEKIRAVCKQFALLPQFQYLRWHPA
jgi:uncharacterized protein (DUF362 family)